MDTLPSIFSFLFFEMLPNFRHFACFLHQSKLLQTQHVHTLCDSINHACETGRPLRRTTWIKQRIEKGKKKKGREKKGGKKEKKEEKKRRRRKTHRSKWFAGWVFFVFELFEERFQPENEPKLSWKMLKLFCWAERDPTHQLILWMFTRYTHPAAFCLINNL